MSDPQGAVEKPLLARIDHRRHCRFYCRGRISCGPAFSPSQYGSHDMSDIYVRPTGKTWLIREGQVFQQPPQGGSDFLSRRSGTYDKSRNQVFFNNPNAGAIASRRGAGGGSAPLVLRYAPRKLGATQDEEAGCVVSDQGAVGAVRERPFPEKKRALHEAPLRSPCKRVCRSDIYVRHIMRPGFFRRPNAGRMICGPYGGVPTGSQGLFQQHRCGRD